MTDTRAALIEQAVSRAQLVEGNTTPAELRWLAEQASQLPPCGLIVEVGTFCGRSARAMLNAMPVDGLLICVDHFQGTSGDPRGAVGSTRRYGPIETWWRFLHEFAPELAGAGPSRITPLKLSSICAADILRRKRADLVFIDAAHDAASVDEDLRSWLPIVKPGGLLCGHNYNTDNPGVVETVAAWFPDVVMNPVGSIWAVRSERAEA